MAYQRAAAVAWLTLGITGLSAIGGALRHPAWYGLAAAGAWVFGYLAGFSVGLYAAAAAFAFAALALGHAGGWIRSRARAAAAVALGLAVGLAAVTWVDDYWLFYPVRALLRLLLGTG